MKLKSKKPKVPLHRSVVGYRNRIAVAIKYSDDGKQAALDLVVAEKISKVLVAWHTRFKNPSDAYHCNGMLRKAIAHGELGNGALAFLTIPEAEKLAKLLKEHMALFRGDVTE